MHGFTEPQTPVPGVFSWTSQHVAASAADLFFPPTKIWRGCTPYSQTAVRPQTSGPCASSWLDPWFHHAACTSSSHSTSALLHWLLTRKSTILYTLLCNKYFPLLLTPAELSNSPMSLQYAVLTKEISMLAMSHAHSFLNLAPQQTCLHQVFWQRCCRSRPWESSAPDMESGEWIIIPKPVS